MKDFAPETCVEIKDKSITGGISNDDFSKFASELESSGYSKSFQNDRFVFRKVSDIEFSDLPERFKDHSVDFTKFSYHKSVKYYVGLIEGFKIAYLEKEIAYFDNPQ